MKNLDFLCFMKNIHRIFLFQVLFSFFLHTCWEIFSWSFFSYPFLEKLFFDKNTCCLSMMTIKFYYNAWEHKFLFLGKFSGNFVKNANTTRKNHVKKKITGIKGLKSLFLFLCGFFAGNSKFALLKRKLLKYKKGIKKS